MLQYSLQIIINNKELSLNYLKKSADLNNGYSCYLYSTYIENPLKLIYLKKASDLKIPIAMYNYSKIIENKEESLNLLIESSKLNCDQAKYDYGKILLENNNIEEGLKLIKEVAENSYPPAITTLGLLLIEGKIIDQNINNAITLIEAAAKDGYPTAMFHYSILLKNGIGVPKNDFLSQEYLQKAANLGESSALKILLNN